MRVIISLITSYNLIYCSSTDLCLSHLFSIRTAPLLLQSHALLFSLIYLRSPTPPLIDWIICTLFLHPHPSLHIPIVNPFYHYKILSRGMTQVSFFLSFFLVFHLFTMEIQTKEFVPLLWLVTKMLKLRRVRWIWSWFLWSERERLLDLHFLIISSNTLLITLLYAWLKNANMSIFPSNMSYCAYAG